MRDFELRNTQILGAWKGQADTTRADDEFHMNEGDYQDKIEAEDDNIYLVAVEGKSCEEARPEVSDDSWCGSQECRL